MSKKIINLTLPLVNEEIEDILETYPKSPYRQAFSPSNLRQDLIAYVLSRIPNMYAVIEETHGPSIDKAQVCWSEEERLYIDSLIHLGIQHVLHRSYDQVNRYIPQLTTSIPAFSD